MKWQGQKKELAYLKENNLDILVETGKLGAKLADTPIEQNHNLHLKSEELLEEKRISKIGGKSYLSHYYKA